MDFQIDNKTGIPIYRQIIEQVKLAVSRDDMGTGDQLPTVRQLAVDLSINPNTVVRAYRELEREGVLESQQGSGTFITGKKPEIDPLQRQRKIDQILNDTLARAWTFGITIPEVIEALVERQEAT